MKSIHIRLITLSAIVLLTALTRLLPHLPNFTPVAALALFGSAMFERRVVGLLAPLAAMLLSDALIGFHGTMPYVYGSFALSWLLGLWVRKNPTALTIGSAALVSSVLFFLITNFGVWYGSAFYPQTSQGLMTCYLSAVPFFRYTVLGDLFYSAVLFGGYFLLQQRYTVLRLAR
ncbi:hypothetical protein GCM10023189_50350 [Nibrella saemangeumensis]|uniref:Rod shape-determining protein MreD n=1 Tax=Nibrella saemangeumensis TaxID=1084526 RepID=A0ABP8NGW6_9BACT